MNEITEQENFWKGNFGEEYIARNSSEQLVKANENFFRGILPKTEAISSVIELGCNIGLNLITLQKLLPEARLHGVEINAQAAAQAQATLPQVAILNASILEWTPAEQHDLAFTKGVLIHIAPEKLPEVYDKLVASSKKYVFIAEYYNPTPMEINYRGHSNRLFKRDFAGEIMDSHRELELVKYGFAWRRDPIAPQDDLTWFLFRKK